MVLPRDVYVCMGRGRDLQDTWREGPARYMEVCWFWQRGQEAFIRGRVPVSGIGSRAIWLRVKAFTQ
jgi:hypothetical protein